MPGVGGITPTAYDATDLAWLRGQVELWLSDRGHPDFDLLAADVIPAMADKIEQLRALGAARPADLNRTTRERDTARAQVAYLQNRLDAQLKRAPAGSCIVHPASDCPAIPELCDNIACICCDRTQRGITNG